MKFVMQKEILSRRQLRIISIFWNTLQFASHSATKGIVSGSVLTYLRVVDKVCYGKDVCIYTGCFLAPCIDIMWMFMHSWEI